MQLVPPGPPPASSAARFAVGDLQVFFCCPLPQLWDSATHFLLPVGPEETKNIQEENTKRAREVWARDEGTQKDEGPVFGCFVELHPQAISNQPAGGWAINTLFKILLKIFHLAILLFSISPDKVFFTHNCDSTFL